MKAAIFAIIAALVPIAALADADQRAMTTDEFVIKCKAEHDWCVKAIQSHHDLDLLMSTLGARRRVCAPQSLAADAKPQMILDWLSHHPGSTLEDADKSLWSCH